MEEQLIYIGKKGECLVIPDREPSADEAITHTLRSLFHQLSVHKSRTAVEDLIKTCAPLVYLAAWSRASRRWWRTYNKLEYALTEVEELESVGLVLVWRIAESLIRRPKDLVIVEPLRYIRAALRRALDREDRDARKGWETDLEIIERWKEGKLEPKLFGAAPNNDAPFDGNVEVLDLYQLVLDLCSDQFETAMIKAFVKRATHDERVPVRVVVSLLNTTEWQVRSGRAALYERLRDRLLEMGYADIGPLTPPRSTSRRQTTTPWPSNSSPTSSKARSRRVKKKDQPDQRPCR